MATEANTTGRIGMSNSPSAPSSRARNLFVWGTWALLFLSTLAYVWKYSHDIPIYDDWSLAVPIMTGQRGATVTWLWEQYFQHRFPFQKLMLHAWKSLGVRDLRAPLFFNVCALGMLAFAMIAVVKRVRGRISYADAFFPLALLHWGRPDVLLWPVYFFYVVPMILTGILLLVIVGWGTRLTFANSVVAGVCLVLLPLCGSVGMVCVPLPVLWLGYVGIHKWRSAQPNDVRCGSLILAFVLFGLLVVGFYFRNFVFGSLEQTPHYVLPETDSVGIRLERALQVLAGAVGMGGAESLWPFSGPTLAALLLISAALLIVILWNQPRERSRALGLLLFVGFVACYALLLGWERSRCLAGYFGIFPALGLCCLYYVWGLYGSSRACSSVQLVLFAIVCAIFPLNTCQGLTWAWWHHYENMEPMEQALWAGAPPYKIIRYHRQAFFAGVSGSDAFLEIMPRLRDAGCGNFRYMGKDPSFREVPLSLTPTAVKGLTWNEGTARVSKEDDYLIFPVPERKLVAGVRITYIHSGDAGGRPAFKLFWKRSDQKEFPTDQSLSMPWLETGSEEKTTETIWIDETIDQLRIHPDDKPCDFKILKIVLIVPTDQ